MKKTASKYAKLSPEQAQAALDKLGLEYAVNTNSLYKTNTTPTRSTDAEKFAGWLGKVGQGSTTSTPAEVTPTQVEQPTAPVTQVLPTNDGSVEREFNAEEVTPIEQEAGIVAKRTGTVKGRDYTAVTYSDGRTEQIFDPVPGVTGNNVAPAAPGPLGTATGDTSRYKQNTIANTINQLNTPGKILESAVIAGEAFGPAGALATPILKPAATAAKTGTRLAAKKGVEVAKGTKVGKKVTDKVFAKARADKAANKILKDKTKMRAEERIKREAAQQKESNAIYEARTGRKRGPKAEVKVPTREEKILTENTKRAQKKGDELLKKFEKSDTTMNGKTDTAKKADLTKAEQVKTRTEVKKAIKDVDKAMDDMLESGKLLRSRGLRGKGKGSKEYKELVQLKEELLKKRAWIGVN
jgi:hypothetical protein